MSSIIKIVVINDSDRLQLWSAACLDSLSDLAPSPIVECYSAMSICGNGLSRGPERTQDYGLNKGPAAGWMERLLLKGSQAIQVADDHWSYDKKSMGTSCAHLAPLSLESKVDQLQNADLIMDFTGSSLEKGLKTWPKYGVWTFEPKLLACRGLRPFISEFFSKDSVIQIKLIGRIIPNGPHKILREGYFSHREKSFNYLLDEILFQVSQWPAYVLRCEINNGIDYLEKAEEYSSKSDSQESKTPNILKFGAKVLIKRTMEKLHSLFFHDQWAIGIIHGAIQDLAASGPSDPKLTWLIEPATRNDFFADPFALETPDGIYILYEYMDHTQPVGRICYSKFSRDLDLLESGVVFQPGYHISYPFLLQDQDSIYCLPEAGAAKRLSLFKAVNFPTKWEEISTISDNIRAVDPTIFKHDNLWWIAYTDGAIDENSALCLMYSQEITGPWKFHQMNPVKMDVRSSRPAGAVFRNGENLYRPGQDCSQTYGWAVAINLVTQLTPTEFKEETVNVIKPFTKGPYTKGLHTVCPLENHTVVDARRRVFVPSVFKRRLIGKLRMG